MLVFKQRGKLVYPEKNLLEQGGEPTTNSTHIWRRRQDSNPGHIGGRRVLSPLLHPCSSKVNKFLVNDKITGSYPTNMSSKHYIKRYKSKNEL